MERTFFMTVGNVKGGTGKTTTVVNLGAALSEQGKKVLVVDLDPHGSATDWLIEDRIKVMDGSYILFKRTETIPKPQQTKQMNLDILPSTPMLIEIEKKMKNNEVLSIFRENLLSVSYGYDFVLIDTPPRISNLLIYAIEVTHNVIIPSDPYYPSILGVADTIRELNRINKFGKHAVQMMGLLFIRVPSHLKHAMEIMQNVRSQLRNKVFLAQIRADVRFPEAASFHEPILLYSPASRGAEDFRVLTREFLEKLHGSEIGKKKFRTSYAVPESVFFRIAGEAKIRNESIGSVVRFLVKEHLPSISRNDIRTFYQLYMKESRMSKKRRLSVYLENEVRDILAKKAVKQKISITSLISILAYKALPDHGPVKYLLRGRKRK